MTFSNTTLTQVSILQSVQQLLSRPAAAPVGQPDEDHDGLCSGFRNSVPVGRLSLLPVLLLPPASPSSVLWGRSLPELQARPVWVSAESGEDLKNSSLMNYFSSLSFSINQNARARSIEEVRVHIEFD